MRILFPLIALGILILVCLVIDQLFVRLLRLFVSHHLSNIIRFSLIAFWTVLLVGSISFGHWVTRLQVEVRTADIVSDRVPTAYEGFRIAHISDFHIGSMNSEAGRKLLDDIIDTLIAEKPDIICFTGDMVTLRAAEAVPFRSQLKRLADSGIPIYSILGNHDYADYNWNWTQEQRDADIDSLRHFMVEVGWQMLDNRSMVLHRDSSFINIVGVGNVGEPPFTTYGSLKDAMAEIGGIETADSTFTVLLSHNPIHWREEVLPETRIDLMLAGHTHAWQLRILGYTPAVKKYPECDGLYHENQRYLYVNTGLGCTGPTVRIGVKPEITLLTLKKSPQ